jgi:hypothetical protein
MTRVIFERGDSSGELVLFNFWAAVAFMADSSLEYILETCKKFCGVARKIKSEEFRTILRRRLRSDLLLLSLPLTYRVT